MNTLEVIEENDFTRDWRVFHTTLLDGGEEILKTGVLPSEYYPRGERTGFYFLAFPKNTDTVEIDYALDFSPMSFIPQQIDGTTRLIIEITGGIDNRFVKHDSGCTNLPAYYTSQPTAIPPECCKAYYRGNLSHAQKALARMLFSIPEGLRDSPLMHTFLRNSIKRAVSQLRQ